MNSNNKDFRTSDLALTTALCVCGFKVDGVDAINPRRSVFVFEDGEKLRETIDRYWRQELQVEPQEFFNQLKLIKARIYER